MRRWTALLCFWLLTLATLIPGLPRAAWAEEVPAGEFPVFPQPSRAGEFPALAQADQLDGPLGRLFSEAAAEFGVPAPLLVALGYAQTRLDDHGGVPSVAGGYGVMHLVDNPGNQSLREAADLLGADPEALKTDTALNIRGAAALLARAAREEHGGKLPGDLADWYTPVAAYFRFASDWTARLAADAVYEALERGIDVTVKGESLHIAPRRVRPNRGRYEQVTAASPVVQSPDYPPARWVPAHSANYTVASRPSSSPIQYVVIHVAQGSYAGTISWFQNPAAGVSAHYVLRSSDGEITQMVREKDIAWHAGNWTYNQRSIGIEHEGYVTNCTWFTDIQYRASAELVRNITARYGIPRDRQHIIGHNEVPGATHTDPGPCWDWSYYMGLVNGQQWSQVVDNDSANFQASSNWDYSTWNSQKYGAGYRFASPCQCADGAWYIFDIPATGYYDVYIWYPSHADYNPNVPVAIMTANASGDGTVQVNRYIDQTRDGGRWVHLGTFRLLAGRRGVVAVSRWTSTPGYIMADAVRIVRR
ncbi:MAG: N-acetylmuramoyl-L-alanine amidase [Bacillota bacterium]|nr:MAG: amidase [Bacillota bacterium]